MSKVIVIGASAGGVEALKTIVQDLPSDLNAAVLIVLHVSNRYSILPEILERVGRLPASHASDNQCMESGHIYVAASGCHLMVAPAGRLVLANTPEENGFRPSIDVLFRSAAAVYKDRVIGVILSGYLDDGTHGLMMVKSYGGIAVVQDPDDTDFPDMPRSALRYVRVDHCLPLAQIAPMLRSLVNGDVRSLESDLKSELNKEEAMKGEPDTDQPPVPFMCPGCGGTLWEKNESGFVQFQCRIGHRYSPESVIEEHGLALDRALWAALRTLEESGQLHRRLSARSRDMCDVKKAAHFEERARIDEEHAALLHQVLTRPRR